jgi:hypothetical protein
MASQGPEVVLNTEDANRKSPFNSKKIPKQPNKKSPTGYTQALGFQRGCLEPTLSCLKAKKSTCFAESLQQLSHAAVAFKANMLIPCLPASLNLNITERPEQPTSRWRDPKPTCAREHKLLLQGRTNSSPPFSWTDPLRAPA